MTENKRNLRYLQLPLRYLRNTVTELKNTIKCYEQSDRPCTSESNQCTGKIHVKENIGWKTVESLKHNFKKLLIL
jgi:hypothetical protein